MLRTCTDAYLDMFVKFGIGDCHYRGFTTAIRNAPLLCHTLNYLHFDSLRNLCGNAAQIFEKRMA